MPWEADEDFAGIQASADSKVPRSEARSAAAS